MNPTDEYIAFHNGKDDKLTFATDAHGHVTHIIKRVDVRLFDVLSRIKALHSPALPTILALVKTDDCIEVHEEYIRGRTVSQLREEKGTLDDGTLLAIASDVCRSLIAMHGAQPAIVHRDIKPDNIMEREDGGFVLIDFDAARSYREDASTDTRCIATVGYAAPEQYGLSQTDVRSDIFSLGATLYELKTGEAYHLDAKCDGLLKKVIAKCTELDPDKRFQSATELMERLNSLQPAKMRRINIYRAAIAVLSCISIVASFFAVFFGVKLYRPQEAVLPVAVSPVPTADEMTDSESIGYSDACICQFVATSMTADGGHIIQLSGDDPVTVQLAAEGTTDSNGCKATKHIDSISLFACELDQCSIGAAADITDDGKLTVYKEGVYRVSGYYKFGDETGRLLYSDILATSKPDIYAECKCVPVINGPQYPGVTMEGDHRDLHLPDDGTKFMRQLSFSCYFDDRLCTASEHIVVYPFTAVIFASPEGADCGITEDNIFYTDTAGSYDINIPVMHFNADNPEGRLWNFGSRFIILE